MSKTYLVPTNVVVSLDMCSLSSILDGGNVCARGSGIKSVSGDDSLLELLENSIYYITFRVSFHLGK